MRPITVDNYADIRDLTREVSEHVRLRLSSYIEVVRSQLRPSLALGSHVGSKENPKDASAAFAQFKALFRGIASPANLDPDLPDVVDANPAKLTLCPLSYRYSISAPGRAKNVTVTAPVRFVLAYQEFSFSDLRSLMSSRQSKDKLREFILHYALLNYMVTRNKPLVSLFEDLCCPIRSELFDEFGALPITTIAAPARSIRASDAVISTVCKFSGADTAEEVVDLDAWGALPGSLGVWFRDKAATLLSQPGVLAEAAE
jgi:hypothetical protein